MAENISRRNVIKAGVAAAAAGAATVARADDEYGEVSEAVAASAARCSGPWVHPSMAPELEAPLRAGFAIAVEQMQQHALCGLTADSRQALKCLRQLLQQW